jgi:hypothetical protein
LVRRREPGCSQGRLSSSFLLELHGHGGHARRTTLTGALHRVVHYIESCTTASDTRSTIDADRPIGGSTRTVLGLEVVRLASHDMSASPSRRSSHPRPICEHRCVLRQGKCSAVFRFAHPPVRMVRGRYVMALLVRSVRGVLHSGDIPASSHTPIHPWRSGGPEVVRSSNVGANEPCVALAARRGRTVALGSGVRRCEQPDVARTGRSRHRVRAARAPRFADNCSQVSPVGRAGRVGVVDARIGVDPVPTRLSADAGLLWDLESRLNCGDW